MWRDPAAFDRARGSVASWLLAVVHHKAVDAVRREESQRRRQALAEDDLALDAPTATRDVEEEAWSRVVAEQVRTALGALSAPAARGADPGLLRRLHPARGGRPDRHARSARSRPGCSRACAG